MNETIAIWSMSWGWSFQLLTGRYLCRSVRVSLRPLWPFRDLSQDTDSKIASDTRLVWNCARLYLVSYAKRWSGGWRASEMVGEQVTIGAEERAAEIESQNVRCRRYHERAEQMFHYSWNWIGKTQGMWMAVVLGVCRSWWQNQMKRPCSERNEEF